jgi:hypothetical protein
MIWEVPSNRLRTLSFGLSQFHGHGSRLVCAAALTMFKIEVFNGLQMRFGPSKYTSLKTTLQTQPQIGNKDDVVVNTICAPQELTSVEHRHYKKRS